MNRLRASVLLLATGGLLSGCELKAPAGEQAADSPTATEREIAPPQQLPALYSGVLPCADCAGIRYELDLRPDNVYFLRTTYVGTEPDNAFDDVGQWSLSADQTVIVLRGAREAPELFAIEDAVTLRKRDAEGNEIETNLNYDITLQRSYVPLEPAMRLRGWYRGAADRTRGAIFEECLTKLALTVAKEGDHAALQNAYTALRTEPEQLVLANIEGRIVKRPATSAALSQDVLVVDKLVRLNPHESCDSPDEAL